MPGEARVLWGGCDPLVTPRALGPLHDIARQTGGDLAAASEALRIISAVLRKLGVASRGQAAAAARQLRPAPRPT